MTTQLGTVEARARTAGSFNQNASRIMRTLMAHHGMKPPDLGPILEISRTAAYNKLNGSSPWLAAEIDSVSAYFGVSPETFYRPAEELIPAAKSNVVPIGTAPTQRTSGSRWMFNEEAA